MTFEEAEHKAMHTPAIWQRYKIMWEACAGNYEKRIEELEGALRLLVSVSEDGFIESCDSEDSKQWEARMIKAIKAGRYALSEGGGVCQNCMGEGVDLIQSGRMVIKEICTSCNGTGRSDGGADGTK